VNLSKLEVFANLFGAPACVRLFGDSALKSKHGVVEFNSTGITFTDPSCAPENWIGTALRLRVMHKDANHLGLTSVTLRNIDKNAVVVSNMQVIQSDFTFAISYVLTKFRLVQVPREINVVKT